MKNPNRPCPDCGDTKAESFHFTLLKSGTESRDTFCRSCRNKRQRKNRTQNNRNYKYGMAPGQYELILKSQNGVCIICGLPPTDKPLVVDHNHVTGKVRGLLHNNCNTAIGLLNDDPTRADNLAKYLRDSK